MNVLSKVHPHAAAAQAAFHADTVAEVQRAVERDKVVVVGMAWNPNVGRARRILTEKGVPFTYLGYGNYLSGWKQRLAIKLWSGWPTFPQIFVDGQLIGGCSDMVALMEKGELTLR
jgi:monothiol glutaredoxin